jgi:hypothetical protein
MYLYMIAADKPERRIIFVYRNINNLIIKSFIFKKQIICFLLIDTKKRIERWLPLPDSNGGPAD